MDMPTFDELRDRAEHDPEGFEALRAELIDDCIRRSAARNQRRLRGLQFVIDARRRIAGNPMKALMDIQAMMHESVLDLKRALLFQQDPRVSLAPTSGEVLYFEKPLSATNRCPPVSVIE